jgi:hypothetical protein
MISTYLSNIVPCYRSQSACLEQCIPYAAMLLLFLVSAGYQRVFIMDHFFLLAVSPSMQSSKTLSKKCLTNLFSSFSLLIREDADSL